MEPLCENVGGLGVGRSSALDEYSGARRHEWLESSVAVAEHKDARSSQGFDCKLVYCEEIIFPLHQILDERQKLENLKVTSLATVSKM